MTPRYHKMKLIALAFLFANPLLTHCQDQKVKLQLGIKLGMARSGVGPDQTDNYDIFHNYRTTGGIRVGGFLQIAIGKTVVIQPEALFVVKGFRERIEYAGDEFDSEPLRTGYFEFPLNVLFRLISRSGSFSIGGGPAPSFTFAAANYSYWVDIHSDMGLNFLLSHQWPSGVSVGFNCTKGLKNVIEFEPHGLNLKNNSFGLSVGYTF